MRSFVVLLLVLSCACRYEKTTLQDSKLMKEEVESAGPFAVPADGRLTPVQIMRHIDHNFDDPAEAEWVKARVEEASNSAEAAREMRERQARHARWEAAGLELTKSQLQDALDAAEDEPAKQQYRTMLANYDRMRAEMDAETAHDETSAVAYNRGLLLAHACRENGPQPCVEVRSFP